MRNRVGIVGAGQLGMMLTQAALPLGFTVTVLDPTPNSPASKAGAKQILGSLTDKKKIEELARKSDFVTWEIEHIDTNILEHLEKNGCDINPSPKSLAKIADKLSQKHFLQKNKIPTAPFVQIRTKEDIKKAIEKFGFPIVVKSRFGGYDGRGNFVIKNHKDIREGLEKLGGLEGKELYVEGFVPFTKELAVIAARDTKENITLFPVVETIHKNNILITVLAPAPLPSDSYKRAQKLALDVMKHFHGAGVFGIEMFLKKTGQILINEIAPRVHNSGHFTIEACKTSQFEQHIRAITGMPLGDTSMKYPASAMVNILGKRTAKAELKGIEKVKNKDSVFTHIYGKMETRPQRKMGHITVVGKSLAECLKKAEQARKIIKI